MPMLLLHRLIGCSFPVNTFSLDEIEKIEVLALGGLVRATLFFGSTPATRGRAVMATVLQVTENGRRMAAAFPSRERGATHICLRSPLSIASASASHALERIGSPSAAAERRQ